MYMNILGNFLWVNIFTHLFLYAATAPGENDLFAVYHSYCVAYMQDSMEIRGLSLGSAIIEFLSGICL